MFTLYHADYIGTPQNCIYQHKTEITNKEALIQAVSHDYVCAEYKDNKRNSQNFTGSDCIMMDVDNDHSDNPEEWITSDKISEAFPDVNFAIHYSRNNMQEKEGKSARPRFHILFPIDYTTNANTYKKLKKQVYDFFPYFDKNALDIARFFFGTENPIVEIYAGEKNLSQFLFEKTSKTTNDIAYTEGMTKEWIYDDTPIIAGNRNKKMFEFANKIIKKCNDTETAHQCFLKQAEACTPPLPDSELETIWKSVQKYHNEKIQQTNILDFQYKPEDFSDVGQAEILKKHFYNELRYSDATKFIHYNKKYWNESELDAQLLAQELTNRQLEEAYQGANIAKKRIKETGIDDLIRQFGRVKHENLNKEQKEAKNLQHMVEEYQKYVIQMRDSKKIAATLKEARPMLKITPEELDAYPFLLNTPEGTYDLQLGLAGKKEHSPSDFITKITKVSPGEKGKQLWLDCLNTIFCGNQELIDYVHTICGLVAIGKIKTEALIIAYGCGRNGKSTFWNAISQVLHMYSGSVSADILTVNRFRNVKPEMAEMRGKRLLIAAEMYEGARLDDSMVKQLCSTDRIVAEKKYKAPFDFIPSHTLVLYTNHLPKVSASDDGTWRRLIVIPFNAKIEGNNDIKNYAEFLVEEAGESIVSWIIEGAQKIIEQNYNLNVPEIVQKAIDEYREENDWFKHFLDDNCLVDEGFSENSNRLYEKYLSYCEKNNEYKKSKGDFYHALENSGFTRFEVKRIKFFKGLKLKSDEEMEEEIEDPFAI